MVDVMGYQLESWQLVGLLMILQRVIVPYLVKVRCSADVETTMRGQRCDVLTMY